MLKIAGQELGQNRLARLETMLEKAKGLRTGVLEFCVSNRKTRAVFFGKLHGKKSGFQSLFW